jgi:hypothetical protein
MSGERIKLHGGSADGWSLVVPKLAQAIVVQNTTYAPPQDRDLPYYPDWYADVEPAVIDSRER